MKHGFLNLSGGVDGPQVGERYKHNDFYGEVEVIRVLKDGRVEVYTCNGFRVLSKASLHPIRENPCPSVAKKKGRPPMTKKFDAAASLKAEEWRVSEYECLLICGPIRYESPTFGFQGKELRKIVAICDAHNNSVAFLQRELTESAR
jgi:hypothetical protein